MAVKKLLRLRKNFVYGGEWQFRARMTDHGADRISFRGDQSGTKLAIMEGIAARLEAAKGLARLPKPEPRDSIIFFFEDACEAVVVNFIAVPPNPERKVDVELDMIIETYLRWDPDNFRRIRSSARDTCIAVFKDGSVECGKHNKYFF